MTAFTDYRRPLSPPAIIFKRMLANLLGWLDDRTGYKAIVNDALYEKIPGGAKWRYVWGSTLVFAFVTQLITGIFLWMHYSPSTQTAWESVYYIEHEMTGGWLLRGIHHYMAQAMIVLMVLHLMQVVIAGAYRAPREINFWLGLGLMLTVFGLGLTGYLLPWDQKGYWATQVATKIAGAAPLVGDQLKALAIGGNEYGHHTLTRFFALHAGVLPGVMIGLIVLHLAMFRRYGVTHNAKENARSENFWPEQVLKDGVACLAVLLAVCALSWVMRAELGPPADPAQAYNAARPEWYYLFLFQLLKVVDKVAPGEAGVVLGAHVIPAIVFGLIALMPILGRWRLGHRFNVGFLLILLIACAGLTYQAIEEDNYAKWYAYNAEKYEPGTEAREAYDDHFAKSSNFLSAKELAHAEGERAQVLAARGIPPEGMLKAFREDTKVAGYRLFERHCASCHNHWSEADDDPLRTVVNGNANAANLYNFGDRDWMAGMLDAEQLASPAFFGNTIHADTDMISWVRENINEPLAELEGEEKSAFADNVSAVAAAISAEAALPYQADADAADQEMIAAGRDLAINEFSCIDCHKLGDEGDLGYGPDLTGYASREWLIAFIENPQQERFYSPDNYDEPERMMPAFEDQLTREEIETLADWLRTDWYQPESTAEEATADTAARE
ncbi:MAG: cytochrome b N-terminal domain-containing protein [Planctomycetota bacterium]